MQRKRTDRCCLGFRLPIGLVVAVSLVVATTFIMIPFCYLFYTHQKETEYTDLIISVDNLADQLAVSLSTPVWNYDVATVENIVEGASKPDYIEEIKVFDSVSNNLIFASPFLQTNLPRWISAFIASPQIFISEKEITRNTVVVGRVIVKATDTPLIIRIVGIMRGVIIGVGVLVFFLIATTYILLSKTVITPTRRLAQYSVDVFSADKTESSFPQPPIVAEFQDLLGALQSMVAGLKAAEERYRSIFENAIIGIYQANLSDQFINVNSSFARILGYESPSEVVREVTDIGMQIFDNREDMRALYVELTNQIQVRDYNILFKRKDGERIWVEVNARLVSASNAEESYIEGTLIDISLRRQAQEQLRKLNEELEEIVRERTAQLRILNEAVEQSPVGVVIAGCGNCRIHYVNPGFGKMAGVSCEELRGQLLQTFLDFSTSLDSCRDLMQRLEAQKVLNFDKKSTRTDGTTYWEAVTISPIRDMDGHISDLLFLSQDVTERVLINTELKKAKKEAEEADKAKSMFLANMSHEIRTPMNAIIGMTLLALRTDCTPQQLNYLKKIDVAAKSLLGIINDILDVSKIDAGKLDMEEVPFQLEDVLSQVAILNADKAAEKGLELLYNVHPDVPTWLKGDAHRLGQIVTNLVNNAVKFSTSGEVEVSVERDADLEEDGVRLLFQVRDTGLGIDQDQLAKLFTPFTQADSSTTRTHGGTGLGLSICHRLTEMMNGRIWAESERGKGSVFSFTVALGTVPEKELRLVVPRRLRGKPVLLAGRGATCDINRKALASFGLRTTMVDSFAEVEAALCSAPDPFCLVLLDCEQLDVNSADAGPKIRKLDLAKSPAVVLTVSAREKSLAQSFAEAGERVLVKPVTPSALFNSVKTALGVEPAQDDAEIRGNAVRETNLESIRGARILLAEDDLTNQEVVNEILTEAGMDVCIANNGAEAVDMVREHSFDLVLMDVQMPVMDGYEATRRIRGEKKHTDLPIVAMTASVMPEDREKCLEAGMNGYVAKPIDIKEFFSMLLKRVSPRTAVGAVDKNKCSTPKKDKASPLTSFDTPGLDSAGALQLLGGKKKLYVKLLEKFRERNETTPQCIRQAVDCGQLEDARRWAHTLKGLAATIGAAALSSTAEDLERSFAEGETERLPDQLDMLKANLKEVMLSVDMILQTLSEDQELDEKSSSNTAEMDKDLAAAELIRLESLLDSDYVEAMDCIEKLAGLLRGLVAPDMINLMKRDMERFDIDSIVTTIRNLKRSLDLCS